MSVLFIQRVGGAPGVLAPALRALVFGVGFTVTPFPNDSVAGTQGGDGEITGYNQIDLVANLASASWRPAVRAAIASNVSLASCSTSQDGLTLAAGDVVLLFGQTDAKQNGAYLVGMPSGGAAALSRVSWMANAADFSPGMRIPVTEGTSYAKTIFMQATTTPVVVGTTSISIVQMTASLSPANTSSLSIWKPLARAVSTANIADLSNASVTQDGVTLVAGDLLLVASQTSGAQNGVYVVGTVTAGSAPLTRATWLASSADFVTGMRVPIGPEGTKFGGAIVELATTGPIVVGSTAITWGLSAIPNLTVTGPITNSGTGAIPNIGISAATTSAAGSMSAADKTKLDGITAGAAVSAVGAATPIQTSGGTNPTISILAASGSNAGSMSAADKTKLDAASASPTASVLALRDGSGNLKAAAVDSGAAADLGLWRNGALVAALAATGFLFPKGLATPTIAQSAQTTDVATNDLTIQAQSPWASATTNHAPANINLTMGTDPVSGASTGPMMIVKAGGQNNVLMGQRRTGGGYGAIWVGATTPASAQESNMAFGSDASSVCFLNAPGGGTLYLTIGVGGCLAQVMTSSQNSIAIPTWSWNDGIAALLTQAQSGSGTNADFQIIASRGAAGNVGSNLYFASGAGGTSGTNLPGNFSFDFGTRVSTTSSKMAFLTSSKVEFLNLSPVGGVGTWTWSTAGMSIKNPGATSVLDFVNTNNIIRVTKGQWVESRVTVTYGTTTTVDCSAGNSFQITLTGNITTLTINNAQTGAKYLFTFINGNSGSNTLTKPSNLHVAGGTYTLTTLKPAVDTLFVEYDGTNFTEISRSLDNH